MSSAYEAFVLFLLGMIALIFIVIVISIIGMWRVFSKAGEPGWASLIPFYNTYILFIVSGNEGWKFLLLLVPFYNIYLMIKVYMDLSFAFGKDVAFGIGLLFLPLIFFPILGFDKSTYQLRSAEEIPTPDGGFTANNQSATNVAPQKPEDPWVSGKE